MPKPTAWPDPCYDKGIGSYRSVPDAQRFLNAAQQGLVALRLARLANLVKLYARRRLECGIIADRDKDSVKTIREGYHKINSKIFTQRT